MLPFGRRATRAFRLSSSLWTMAITISAAPRTVLDVELVGVHYSLTPPKAFLALKMAVDNKVNSEDPSLMVATMNEWLVQAVGVETAQMIQARMNDPADDLDVTHIMQLMEAVLSEMSERPTTSPSVSRKSPARTGRTSTAGR